MNEKNQIRLFRDPLDPRELSFGFSQPHTEPNHASGTGQPSTPKYGVTGNHPVLARPDKWGMTFNEAVAYSKELVESGFESVTIREQVPPVSSPDNAQRADEKTLARSGDPATSKAAAKTVKDFLSKHQVEIVCALRRIKDGTFYEIAEEAELQSPQVWRRLNELQRKGLIETTGEERKGPTGRLCRVWRLK